MALNRTKVLEAAQKYLAKSQYDKAIAEYEKLVQEDPRDVRTLLKIGDLHTRRARPKDAVDVYNRVAELYAKQGFFLKAVAVYKQILKLVPGDLPTTERLGNMYEELALTNDALNTYELVADAYITQSNLPRAITTMERMVALDESNVAARIKLAEGLSKADRKPEAAAAFAAGAVLLKEQGRMDDYLRVVERQLYHDAENVGLSRELAALYLERNDAKRALAKLQPCFKSDPRHIPTLEMLAEAFAKLGQAAKTVSVLKEVARLHGEAGDDDERTDALRRILELDPSDAEAKTALAQAKPRKPRPAEVAPTEAPRARDRASIEAEPLDDDDLDLLEDDHDEEPILLVDEDASAQEPASGAGPVRSDPDAWMSEAELLESEERYDEAEALLQRVLNVVPDHEEAHAMLKDLYLATDRRVDAVRELLWLSDACMETDLERARQYALAAHQLAPNSDVTRNRLRALDLEAESASEPDDAIMFVEEEARISARPAEDLRGPEPMTAAPRKGDFDLLDLPVDPDEFEAPPPRMPRPRHSLAELASLLDAPISPTDFRARSPKKSSPTRAKSAPPAAAPPVHDDVASLLDAPMSPDEFGPPAKKSRPPADRKPSSKGQTGSFDLGAAEFDRSDMIDMENLPPRKRRSRPVLEVLDDASSIMPPAETPAAGVPSSGARPDDFAMIDGDPHEARDDARAYAPDSVEEAPDPTLPSEPIPDLIMRSLRPDARNTGNTAVDVQLELDEPEAAPAPSSPEPNDTPYTSDNQDDPFGVLDALSSELELVDGTNARQAAPAAPDAYDEFQGSSVDIDIEDMSVEPAFEPVPGQATPAVETPLPPPEEPTLTDVEDAPPVFAAVASPAASAASAPAAADMADVSATPSGRPIWGPLPAEVEESLDEAEFFANQGLLEEALEVVQEAMLIYPGTPALKAKLAHYESLQVRARSVPPEARESLRPSDASFDIAKQLADQLPEANSPAGHDEMVDVESVFAQFKKGVAQQVSADDTETHFDLAIAYKEMGLIDDAITEFELAAKSPRRACTALTMVAMCYVERNDRQRATAYFERALNSPQQQPNEELGLLYELGSNYEALGQHDKALSAFERVAIRDRTFRGVSARVEQLRRKASAAKGAAR